MGATVSRVFFTLYPSQSKQAFTAEGDWLRKMCLFATVAHAGLTVTGLAFVGFQCMALNALQCCFSYSCYLTLREREIWIYMFILLCQVLLNLLDILGVTDNPAKAHMTESSLQQLGQFIALAMCVLIGYLVGRASYMFRKSGGLHGNLPKGGAPLLLEDQVMGYAQTGAEIAGGMVNDHLDKQDAKERRDEDNYAR